MDWFRSLSYFFCISRCVITIVIYLSAQASNYVLRADLALACHQGTYNFVIMYFVEVTNPSHSFCHFDPENEISLCRSHTSARHAIWISAMDMLGQILERT
jgi:hypothetical protein